MHGAEGPAAAVAVGSRLAPVDRWTMAYAALVSLAVLARWPADRPFPVLLYLSHAGLVGLTLLAPRVRRLGRVGLFLGEFYPLIVVVALYTEIGILNTATGVSHDHVVQMWEVALFGCQPAQDWIRAQPWLWLSWPLHLGYLSYYFILAGAPLGLWITGRHAAARQTILLIMVTFYACYAVFLFFPVTGPRYVFPLAENAATAIPPAVFAQQLLERGAAWGTAFPSSHVAAALVASVSAWRAWRLLGFALVPLAVLLTLGTVYGQFHYAVDALAGALLAGVVLVVSRGRHRPPENGDTMGNEP